MGQGRKVNVLDVDKFGKGEAIKELRLESNVQIYPVHKIDFEKILKTIEWKK